MPTLRLRFPEDTKVGQIVGFRGFDIMGATLADVLLPDNWRVCDGSQLPISEYHTLWYQIGGGYGYADPNMIRLPYGNGGYTGEKENPPLTKRGGLLGIYFIKVK